MNEEKKVIIVDDVVRYIDPMGPKASPLVKQPDTSAFGDKVMLVNKTDEHGMVLCPACQKGSTWKEGEDMKTRGPMQYLTVHGRGKALVHRSCIPMLLQLLFPVAKPEESQVKSSITITPMAPAISAAE